MALMQNDLNATYLRGKARSSKTKSATAERKAPAIVDADAQDAAQWDVEISNSLDVLHAMADKAMANYDAGLTQKISG